MIPVQCQIATNIARNTYGDCVRACIASILELPAQDVPHFYYDGDGKEGMKRAREWLNARSQSLFVTFYPGDTEVADLLNIVGEQNPDTHYMLFGVAEGEGNHCVVCQNNEIVWNPAWFGSKINGPLSDIGVWGVGVIAVK